MFHLARRPKSEPPALLSGGMTTQFSTVNVLRAVAVLMVLIDHLPFSDRGVGDDATVLATVFPPRPLSELMGYGHYGVHLFIAISGFCIHMPWARERNVNARIDYLAFWRRRLTRLYPPYLVAIAISLAALFAIHGVLNRQVGGSVADSFGYPSGTLLAVDLVMLLALVQNFTGASARIGNGPFWSLALEEQLYIMYSPLLAMRRRLGWGVTLAVAGSFTVAWRLCGVLCFTSAPAFWDVVGPSYWFVWVLGAWVAEHRTGLAVASRWVTSIWALALYVALGISCDPPLGLWPALPGSSVIRDLLFGLIGVTVLAIATRWESGGGSIVGRVGSGLASVGIWSYSLYLVHHIGFVASKQVLVLLGLPLWLTLLLRLCAGIALGYGFYRLIEMPSHRYARRIAVRVSTDPRPKSVALSV